ncbi:MAG TPA: Holliday junction resolvase RuvX [Acidimicrobiales bacterium]|nr:Holliday junction resolvase RuvX [Acidimicrobiales bacterium]
MTGPSGQTGGRAIGLDLGAKRIGVAVSDSDRTVATPIEVVTRSRDMARDRLRIGEIVQEWEATTVVVGLPLSLSGQVGPAAKAALAEVEALRATLRVQVETYDERLSTLTAERSLMEQSLRAPARRRVVDKVAAAVMLQAWLDRGRSRS